MPSIRPSCHEDTLEFSIFYHGLRLLGLDALYPRNDVTAVNAAAAATA